MKFDEIDSLFFETEFMCKFECSFLDAAQDFRYRKRIQHERSKQKSVLLKQDREREAFMQKINQKRRRKSETNKKTSGRITRNDGKAAKQARLEREYGEKLTRGIVSIG